MTDDRILRQIKARLSLRAPQSDSLELLAQIIDHSPLKELVPLQKLAGTAEMLAAVQLLFPDVTDFERDFPLCASPLPGVGKTRLMGAFISWLYLTNRSRHFFVLAPTRPSMTSSSRTSSRTHRSMCSRNLGIRADAALAGHR